MLSYTDTTPPQNCLEVFCDPLGQYMNIRVSVLKHKCFGSPRNERQVRPSYDLAEVEGSLSSFQDDEFPSCTTVQVTSGTTSALRQLHIGFCLLLRFTVLC